MEKQPLAQWLNAVFKESDDLMVEVASPAYRFLSKQDLLEALEISPSDSLTMSHIATRLQIIASNIDVRDEKTKLRVISNG